MSAFMSAFLLAVATLTALTASEFIYTEAPFPSAHASNVVELRNGDLLASWFGGSAEGKPDVAIWTSRHTAAGWSAPAELAREPQIACYNPVMFYTHDGRLWFYYKFGPHPSSWSAARRYSDDDGKTWSAIEHLPAGIYGPIRAKPLVMADGTVVSGTSVESYNAWACWIERSTDNGKTWTRIGPIQAPLDGIIQPSVVSLGGNRLRLYARSTQKIGKIMTATSNDAGLTWSPAHAIDVPNPNSGIDAVSLPDGRSVLVYNETPKGRTPLNLAVSKDGEHFQMFRTLESDPGEYSYPALIQGRNGDLHLTYTWNRKRMKYVKIPLSEIP
jgi:predicted neuraminidase